MQPHHKVAKNWAQKTGKKRNGQRMFYEGDRIYSYGHHFLIAQHATNAAGVAAVLMTDDTYSASTTRHCSIVRKAADQAGLPVFFWRLEAYDERIAREEARLSRARLHKSRDYLDGLVAERAALMNWLDGREKIKCA